MTEKQLLADTLAQNQRTISDLSETIEDFSKDQELWEPPGTATSVLNFTVVMKKADWNGSAVTVTKNISGKWLDVTREGKEGVGRIKIDGNQRSYILADFMGNQGSYCFGVVHESMAGKSSGNLTVCKAVFTIGNSVNPMTFQEFTDNYGSNEFFKFWMATTDTNLRPEKTTETQDSQETGASCTIDESSIIFHNIGGDDSTWVSGIRTVISW